MEVNPQCVTIFLSYVLNIVDVGLLCKGPRCFKGLCSQSSDTCNLYEIKASVIRDTLNIIEVNRLGNPFVTGFTTNDAYSQRWASLLKKVTSLSVTPLLITKSNGSYRYSVTPLLL